jgi:hypothetical protein
MNIKEFDRQNLPLLRTSMQAALAPIEAQFGIKIHVGNASFSADNAKFKVDLSTIGDGGVVNSRERSSFEALAELYDLDPKMLDQSILYGGTEYVVTGLNTRRSKYPVIARRVRDGKSFCLPGDGVKTAWAKKQQPFVINNPNVFAKA